MEVPCGAVNTDSKDHNGSKANKERHVKAKARTENAKMEEKGNLSTAKIWTWRRLCATAARRQVTWHGNVRISRSAHVVGRRGMRRRIAL